jgi:hypothetical protein
VAEPGAAPPDVRIRVDPRRVVVWLVALHALLFALHEGAMVSRFVLDHGRWYGFIDFLDVDVENSLSQWVQTATLLGLAVLLGLSATAARSHRFGWWAMAAIFVYLSIDEGSRLHENLIPLLHRYFDPSGIFLFAWVVPAAALVAAFVAAYARLIRDLDPVTRRRFLLAGALYVSGTIGMELVGGWWATDNGFDNATYQMLLVALEEMFEVAGQLTFLHALLRHLEATGPRIALLFGSPTVAAAAAPARAGAFPAGRPDA